MSSALEALVHVAWPAGRPRARRPARRRSITDLPRTGVGAWSWTLICVGLSVIAWELPFFEPGEMSPGGMTLPSAHRGGELVLAPVISVGARVVTLDGRRMATPEEIRAGGVDALGQLQTDLATLHRNWGLLHPRDPFPGSVILSAPPDADWAVLHSILLAAALAEYRAVRGVDRGATVAVVRLGSLRAALTSELGRVDAARGRLARTPRAGARLG